MTSNLRFVVKVAYEYRSYGIKMSDLIQEANIGLMKAVQKFDPDKGIRLISYAVWWIRAYIQNYILKNWSLVKLGTTQAQRKLFFRLARTRRELEKLGEGDGHIVTRRRLPSELNVKPTEVREMEQRMGGRDLSLDAPMGEEGAPRTWTSWSRSGLADDEVADRQEAGHHAQPRPAALLRLDPRERFIIEQRVMGDSEMTLKRAGRALRLLARARPSAGDPRQGQAEDGARRAHGRGRDGRGVRSLTLLLGSPGGDVERLTGGSASTRLPPVAVSVRCLTIP